MQQRTHGLKFPDYGLSVNWAANDDMARLSFSNGRMADDPLGIHQEQRLVKIQHP
jgi:hypothetical protein